MAPAEKLDARFVPKIVVLCACALALNIALLWQNTWSDFPHFYTGATLAGSDQLYNVKTVMVTVDELVPGRTGLLTTRVPANYAIIRPLAAASYPVAEKLWRALSILASLAGIWLLCRTLAWPYVVLSAAAFNPLWYSIAIGQDTAFLLLGCALALWLDKRGRDLAAGVSLGILLLKPYLVVLIPVVLITRRKWRMMAGFVLAGIAIAAGSILAQGGVAWIPEYVAMLQNPGAHPNPDRMFSIRAFVPANAGYFALLAAAILIGAAFASVRLSLQNALAVALAAGMLASYHAYYHDTSLLLFAIIAGLESGHFARIMSVVLLIPFVTFFASGEVLSSLGVILVAAVALLAPRRAAN